MAVSSGLAVAGSRGIPLAARPSRRPRRLPEPAGRRHSSACSRAVLGYQLLLAVTVAPDNWDSLTYHLAARGGVGTARRYTTGSPNAATDRMNVFQPLSEHEILFFFTASGSSRLFAIPQFLAELAVLLAVYGMARRIGFGAAVAACSVGPALHLLPRRARVDDRAERSGRCVLPGGRGVPDSRREQRRARARRRRASVSASARNSARHSSGRRWRCSPGRSAGERISGFSRRASVSFLLLGAWGYWLNLAHTGSVLGARRSRPTSALRHRCTTAPKTVLHVVYRLLDVSVISDRLMVRLAVVGVDRGTPRRGSAIPPVGLSTGGAPRLRSRDSPRRPAARPRRRCDLSRIVTKAIHIPVKTESEAGFDAAGERGSLGLRAGR